MNIQQVNALQDGLQGSVNSVSVAKDAMDAVGAKSSAPVMQVPADAVQAVSQTIDVNQLKRAVDQVNKFVGPISSDLKFTVDESTGINVVKVIDLSTKDVIRQIPSEEMLSIARSLDKLQGLLIKQKV